MFRISVRSGLYTHALCVCLRRLDLHYLAALPFLLSSFLQAQLLAVSKRRVETNESAKQTNKWTMRQDEAEKMRQER